MSSSGMGAAGHVEQLRAVRPLSVTTSSPSSRMASLVTPRRSSVNWAKSCTEAGPNASR